MVTLIAGQSSFYMFFSYMWKGDEVGYMMKKRPLLLVWRSGTTEHLRCSSFVTWPSLVHLTVLNHALSTDEGWAIQPKYLRTKLSRFRSTIPLNLGQRKVKWTFKLDLHVCPFMKEKKPDSRFRTLAGKRQTSLFEFLPSLLGINSPLLLLCSLGTRGWRVHKVSGQGWV